MPIYDVILPAGGRVDAALAQAAGGDVKAIFRFGEETILGRTVRVLRESDLSRRIVAIGGDAVRMEAGFHAVHSIPEAGTGPENILNGLKWLRAQPDPPARVIVATTDMPFLTAEIIRRFVALCPEDRAIAVPLISRAEWEARFPGSHAMFIRLGDGSWTTGGLFLLDTEALERSMPQIERIFAQRKSKLGMARLLGPAFVLGLLRKTLTVPQIEAKIQAMLGCSGAAVRGAPPELAYDIDGLEDYEYAMRVGA